ncbi:MAG: hypothetical protein HY791_19525 [Deltaproteobacteria bacterium]|nr:hypothetical protein [Deltaproteobacteria bacterium]
MSDDRAYRVELRFVQEGDGAFIATAKELDLSARGASRADAISALEATIETRLQAAAAGEPLPRPIDVAEVDGKITIQLATALARELAYVAKSSGSTPEAIAAQLVARGLGAVDARPRREPRRDAPEAAPADAERAPEAGPRDNQRGRNDRGDRGGADRGAAGGDRGRGRDRRREGYRPELDDKANFMEYLRGLDKGGPTRGRGGNDR